MAALRLAYHLQPGAGNSVLPPITILHGLFGSKTNWKSIASRLSQKLNRQVYTIDARNHGESPHSNHMSFELMSEDTIALLKDLGVTKTVLVGHSMGGKTAMVTALNHPTVVDRLLVLDVAPVSSVSAFTSDLQSHITALKSLDCSTLRDRRQADEQLKDHITEDSVRQFLLANLVFDHKEANARWRVNIPAIERNLRILRNFPDFSDTSYSGQTHFIGGALSKYIPKAASPEMNRLFPNYTLAHIPDAGHWLHYDKPVEFLNLICSYLEKK